MCAQKRSTTIRREQIAIAALDIVQIQGLKALTIEGVATSIGLVPSAIYRHYKNKNEVLDAVLDLIQNRLLNNVDVAVNKGGSSLDILKNLLMIQSQAIQIFPAILPRILFSDEVLSDHTGRKRKVYLILSVFLDKISKIFKKGQDTGEIRTDISPDSLAVQFFGLFQPSAFLFLFSEGDFNVNKQTKSAWTLFSENLKPTLG